MDALGTCNGAGLGAPSEQASDESSAPVTAMHEAAGAHTLEQRPGVASKVFESSHDGILVTDPRGTILFVNPAFSRLTGYSADEVVGRNPRILQSGLQSESFYRELWETIQRDGFWHGEVWNRRKDGTTFVELLAISAVTSATGAVEHYVGVFSDLTELKEACARLASVSRQDALTGLLSRHGIQDEIDAMLQAGQAFACLAIDVDRMCLINEIHGLVAGDGLLREIARRVGAQLPDAGAFGRVGSDEFLAVLPGEASEEALAHLIARIAAALAEPIRIDGRVLEVSVSMGAVLLPCEGSDASRVLGAAMAALERAQREGGRQQRFFSPEVVDRAKRWLLLEHGLRQALERGELHLHYQPQVDVAACRVVGVEALLRWNSAEFGAVSPAEFIPVAEHSGLIVQIGTWVLNEACRTVAAWDRAGLPAVRVAVNVSGLQVLNPDFAAVVADALSASGLDPKYLELEVTESVMVGSEDAVIRVLEGIRARGVRLAMDDFGTGYSSMTFVNRLQFDLLKIDQSFVRQITSEPRSAAIARATVAMSKGLGMHTIAEGVETPGQLRFLRGAGCDLLQGYLFSKPVPAADIEALLAADAAFPQYAVRRSESRRTLLCVDDEEYILSSVVRVLRHEGYRVLTATSAESALELLATNEVQVVMSDMRMPSMSGVEFLRRVKELYPQTIRIILSAYGDLDSLTDAINSSAIFRFLCKPWDDEHLKAHIKQAFEIHEGLYCMPSDEVGPHPLLVVGEA